MAMREQASDMQNSLAKVVQSLVVQNSIKAVSTVVLMLLLITLGACATGPGVYHTVKEGETLWRISKTQTMIGQFLIMLNSQAKVRLNLREKLSTTKTKQSFLVSHSRDRTK
ncbi:MAG: LysM peptidoglycan-binding domain-containing protein [Deltaproteobacteria bacterium]|uniref:LysM peptidoglycan-binding domain-containing protein n=1 Tax=Candidatus Zymogenus saltonus TaxID=2844893 RepID=A0A9D8KEE6_9DELT|nr:LysM peptidoglycan-binding domain-containing protein [Candidatus Zymogenus saltonus]